MCPSTEAVQSKTPTRAAASGAPRGRAISVGGEPQLPCDEPVAARVRFRAGDTTPVAMLAIANHTPVLLSRGMADVTGAPHALVAPDRPDLLARRLRALAADPGALDALRTATHPLRVERGWTDVADAHVALYEEVRACPWP